MRRLFALVIVCCRWVRPAACTAHHADRAGAAALPRRRLHQRDEDQPTSPTAVRPISRANPSRSSWTSTEPTGDTVTSRPAIVWIHGGGFTGGDKTSAEIVAEANAFAKKGFVNVSINYRLRADARLNPAPCDRCDVDASTTRKLRCASCVPTRRRTASTSNRIAAAGTSAGAITADARRVQLRGPGRRAAIRGTRPRSVPPSRSPARAHLAPINAGEPPSLSFHGTNGHARALPVGDRTP